MPKKPGRVETDLARVAACAADPTSEASIAALRGALEKSGSFAVAAAAKLVEENDVQALAPLLAPAYLRIADKDPGCKAKVALVEALERLGRDEPDVFLHAARCRQMEPIWGGQVDTAANLRPLGAAGLAASLHPEAGAVIARLLADSEWTSRAGAARAAARLPPDVAVPLLILRAEIGDVEPPVLGDCFRALLDADPARGVAFVAARLDGKEDLAEQAALALGESRVEAAFAPLCEYAERAAGERRKTALLALALLRRDEAVAYLVGLVREAHEKTAEAAIAALAIHKHDPRVRETVLAAAKARRDKALLEKARAALD
jgi:hypothetical protein